MIAARRYVAAVEQRISLVTLGITDLTRARTFYERLGWHGQEIEETVFFQAGSIVLVLWGRDKLAADAGIEGRNTDGFGGVTLAHNVRSRIEVDEVLATQRTPEPRSHRRRERRSTAVTPAVLPTRTATSGRSPTTPAFPSVGMAQSPFPTSARHKATAGAAST